MAYLVSKYKHLFPLGTFDAPKRINTWNQSHRLFALNQKKDKKSQQQLAPGLILKKGHLNFKKGFTNYRCLEIDPNKRKTRILFENQGQYPVKVFEKPPKLLGLATLGYFYFTTNPKEDEIPAPEIKVNNLLIHEEKLFQLPVVNRTAVAVYQNGQVKLPLVEAMGTLKIGGKNFKWRGAKTLARYCLSPGEIVVYTASAGRIIPYVDKIMGPGRLAKKVITPKQGVIDLIIDQEEEKLKVMAIKKGGATEVTKGLMVLSGEEGLLRKIKKGDVLSAIQIEKLNQNQILDAVSIGPQLFEDKKKRVEQSILEGHENDESLCNRPHREGIKLARSALATLKDGRFVAIIVDGIPQAGEIYPGVTPQELTDFAFGMYPKATKVVATDPGGSAKMVYRQDKEIVVFGNLHYLKYKYLKDGSLKFAPNGRNGRKAVTFLGVY